MLEVNPTYAPAGWKWTHDVKSGKQSERCSVESVVVNYLNAFAILMEHPMEARLTLGAAVEQYNLFALDKFISFDNRNSSVLKRHSDYQKKLAKVLKLRVSQKIAAKK